MPAPITLTPEQLAKQAERKAAKLAKKAAQAASGETNAQQKAELERRRILKREWQTVGSSPQEDANKATIVTWNMLAQTLIRRQLFPGSDALKWGDRKPMLEAELERFRGVDVICLQECDKLQELSGAVPDHEAIEARGVGKAHGCVVLYKRSRFDAAAQLVVSLDDEDLSPEAGSEAARRGISRQTKNIALAVALGDKERPGKGIVVVTTHLFWHPRFQYERARQTIVLLRAVRRLQKDKGLESWPVVLAGDLNSQPAETAYQFLAAPHLPLDPAIAKTLEESRIVHTSAAKALSSAASEPPSEAASGTATPAGKDEDEEAAAKDENSIANTRAPEADDGIRSLDDLLAALREVLPEPARSAYETSEWQGEKYAARLPDGITTQAGRNEPAYTCYSPLFKLTLDYLFVLPPLGGAAWPQVTQLLGTPKAEELGNGVPMKGIIAADHLPVGCEVVWA
ncbi:RNA exonuclease ngl2 [Vanrija albida]|uniref:RNA exonuclease ngl2 n=1 Tax=Vanrija albida TaxID=181172 RepID=A0ABR3Q3D9_9TREE